MQGWDLYYVAPGVGARTVGNWLWSVQVGAYKQLFRIDWLPLLILDSLLCTWYPLRKGTTPEWGCIGLCLQSSPLTLEVEFMLSWIGMRKMCLLGSFSWIALIIFHSSWVDVVALFYSQFRIHTLPPISTPGEKCHLFTFIYSTQINLFSVPIHPRLISITTYIFSGCN